MVQIEGFRRLAEKARDIPEPALIFQIVALQGSFLEHARICSPKGSPGVAAPTAGSSIAGFEIEHGRSRACSTNCGYPLRPIAPTTRPSETDLPVVSTEEDAVSSIAGQGLNIAFNFVSELLR